MPFIQQINTEALIYDKISFIFTETNVHQAQWNFDLARREGDNTVLLNSSLDKEMTDIKLWVGGRGMVLTLGKSGRVKNAFSINISIHI